MEGKYYWTIKNKVRVTVKKKNSQEYVLTAYFKEGKEKFILTNNEMKGLHSSGELTDRS
ncbi:MAG: hypothetical protein PF569_03855 [Candidatus Woesearchaeota archaeon]|nr:hypothetical protein [Candidatus Woesearchaeota archaeon]